MSFFKHSCSLWGFVPNQMCIVSLPLRVHNSVTRKCSSQYAQQHVKSCHWSLGKTVNLNWAGETTSCPLPCWLIVAPRISTKRLSQTFPWATACDPRNLQTTVGLVCPGNLPLTKYMWKSGLVCLLQTDALKHNAKRSTQSASATKCC